VLPGAAAAVAAPWMFTLLSVCIIPLQELLHLACLVGWLVCGPLAVRLLQSNVPPKQFEQVDLWNACIGACLPVDSTLQLHLDSLHSWSMCSLGQSADASLMHHYVCTVSMDGHSPGAHETGATWY
jgi:hypothetical protein